MCQQIEPAETPARTMPRSQASRSTHVATQKITVSGYPALKVRARMPEKAFTVTAEVILVRVDPYAGYLITTESMAQDTAAVDPTFAQILSSLHLGPRPRKVKLPVKND